MKSMKELREMILAIRNKGLRGTTPGDLLLVIVQIIRITGVISAVMAIIRVVTDLVTIVGALKEEMEGRIIDSESLKGRIRISFLTRRFRMPKNIETKKSAETIRSATRSQGKTSSMRKMM